MTFKTEIINLFKDANKSNQEQEIKRLQEYQRLLQQDKKYLKWIVENLETLQTLYDKHIKTHNANIPIEYFYLFVYTKGMI